MKALLIWVVLLYRGQAADAEKRILLSDSSYVHQLEVKLQELTAKVDLVTSANQQLTAKVDNVTSANQQLTANQQLIAKVDHLTAEMYLVNSANQHLTAKLDHLTAEMYLVNSAKEHLTANVDHLTAEVYLVTSANQHLTAKVNQLTAKVDNVTNANQQLTAKVDLVTTTSANQQLTTTANNLATGGSGGLYIRWGRTSCPNTTALVYQGYAGGSWLNHTGAAANHVCMPSDPEYELDALIGPTYALIYGTEYEDVFFGRATHDDDVPCAVCRSPARSSVLMIPGRNTCYQGWTHEYGGYLASGGIVNKAATEYICLDHDPESVPLGDADRNGAVLYYVSSKCGSLACPPYVDSKTLSCVVCSK